MTSTRSCLAACALAIAGALSGAAHAQGSFDPSDEDQDSYVRGNLYFLAYHEIGHLLLDQALQADQAANRMGAEQSADDVATWLMLPDPDEPDQDDDIWAAMQGWLSSSSHDEAPAQSPHYPDDADRAAAIACYLYGSNPDLYPDLPEAFPNALDSVDCEEEFEALDADMVAWFSDHVLPEGAAPVAYVEVSYEPAPAHLAAARAYLIETEVLRDAADDIEYSLRLPNPVFFTGRSCGPGAAEFRYNRATRTVTACYEAIAWFMSDAAGEIADREANPVEVWQGEDELGSGGSRVRRRPRPR